MTIKEKILISKFKRNFNKYRTIANKDYKKVNIDRLKALQRKYLISRETLLKKGLYSKAFPIKPIF